MIESAIKICLLLCLSSLVSIGQQKDSIVYIHGTKLELLHTISGRISPKSVVANGKGKFFAQNMMYKHTITVYDRNYTLLQTIADNVKLSDYGYSRFKGNYKGAPVECAFSHNGKYAWVSNYEMTGGTSKEFSKPGCDACNSPNKYDSSFVYKINTSTYKIEKVILVGAVPKYVAVTPDNSKVLVTNWSSGDLSIINTQLNKEVKRIPLGRFPRGIVVSNDSKYAYIAIMGSTKIAKLNLNNYAIEWIENVGRHPRHLCLAPRNDYLYVSLNGEGKIAKIDLQTKKVIAKKSTGRLPRSMDISKDGKFLYVVNYGSNEVTKLETSTMKIMAKAKTKSKPIGITFDADTKNIWTACYSGRIMIFHDTYYDSIAVNYTQQEELLAQLEREKKRKKATKTHYNHRKEKPIINKKIEGKYILVSGSFATSGGARRRVAELKRKGIKAHLYYNQENKRNYAYIGAFYTRSEALAFAKKQNIESWAYKLPPEDVKPKNNKENNSVTKENSPKEEKTTQPSTTEKKFLLVSGSFKNKKNALTRVKELKKINPSAFVYYNQKNGNYYACLGSFDTKEEAKKYLLKSKEEAWVFSSSSR